MSWLLTADPNLLSTCPSLTMSITYNNTFILWRVQSPFADISILTITQTTFRPILQCRFIRGWQLWICIQFSKIWLFFLSLISWGSALTPHILICSFLTPVYACIGCPLKSTGSFHYSGSSPDISPIIIPPNISNIPIKSMLTQAQLLCIVTQSPFIFPLILSMLLETHSSIFRTFTHIPPYISFILILVKTSCSLLSLLFVRWYTTCPFLILSTIKLLSFSLPLPLKSHPINSTLLLLILPSIIHHIPHSLFVGVSMLFSIF